MSTLNSLHQIFKCFSVKCTSCIFQTYVQQETTSSWTVARWGYEICFLGYFKVCISNVDEWGLKFLIGFLSAPGWSSWAQEYLKSKDFLLNRPFSINQDNFIGRQPVINNSNVNKTMVLPLLVFHLFLFIIFTPKQPSGFPKNRRTKKWLIY